MLSLQCLLDLKQNIYLVKIRQLRGAWAAQLVQSIQLFGFSPGQDLMGREMEPCWAPLPKGESAGGFSRILSSPMQILLVLHSVTFPLGAKIFHTSNFANTHATQLPRQSARMTIFFAAEGRKVNIFLFLLHLLASARVPRLPRQSANGQGCVPVQLYLGDTEI